MEQSVSPRLRVASIAAAAVIVLSSFALAAPAHADTAPTNPADPKTPTTVTADSLPTPQINGVVWSQTIVGNTVYAGGNFTTAQPAGSASGANTVSRPYLLSYNLTTGVLNSAFAPVLNGQVRAVTASPDGSRLYVGGAFTTVNGANAYRVVALDPTSGAVLPGFAPTINSTVNAIAVNGSSVYIGGVFSSVNKETHNKVAAVTTAGKNIPFTASADGGDVNALAVSPDGQKLVVGGSFTTLNGSSNPGYGLGAVDATGALQPWASNNVVRNAGTQAAITSLTSDATGVYGSGYTFGPGTLEGSFRADWATGNLAWVEDCHGDTYSVAVTDNAEYVAGHPHYCGNIGGFPQTDPQSNWTFHRAIAFSKDATQTVTADPYGYYNWAGNPAPSLLNWYPEFNTGTFTGKTQGPWSVAANSKYVVYGGEFTTVNGVRQQGLARFAVPSAAPKKMGPQASGATFVPSGISLSSGSVRLSWPANSDPDNSLLSYELYRDNNQTTPIYKVTADSSVWNKPAMGFTDTGLTPGATYSYRLRATDPDGNTVLGDGVSVTVSSKQPSTYTNTVLAQGASSFWRFDEASGTTVFDAAGYNDMTAGSGVSRGAAGATVDGDTASTFDGTGNGLAATRTAVAGPQTFSVEAWVKTTSTDGGKIVGFGNSPTGTSSSYDRHLYMDQSGKVNFGVYNGNTQTLTSPSALNDGAWHQLVGTLSSSGMQLFVDGKRVGTRSDVTNAQDYSGYWRVGGDSSWSGANFLNGSIDDVSVYPTALTQTQANNQYVAAGYASQLNSAPSDNYGSRVFTDDPYLYYRLGDAAGASTAKDSSLSGASGSYAGGVTQGTEGALSGVSDTAATFDGSSGQVNSSQSFNDPEVYTIESWFKTTTTSGGKIVGFGSSQTGQSGSYDRHVYMQDNGQLVFGTYTGQTNTITTQGSYNDGTWHQVVASQSSDGLKLYVDGVLQGTNPTPNAQAYTGYWKIGGDTTWGSSSAYFAGSIDEVSIYSRALSAATVSDHYALGVGTVNVAPTSSFTSSVKDLSASFDASASADTDGTVAGYAWDFGDNASGTGKTPAHTYDKAGTYTVTLTVTDDKGAVGTSTGQVTVTAPRVNAAPTASFTSTTTDLSAAFDASASSDFDGSVASSAWDFGDGQTGTGKTVTHAYTQAGTYSVKLTVTDNEGLSSTSTSSVTVTAPRVNAPPTAAFTATTTNLGVSVSGAASTDSDGSISSYAWDFGDGSSATTATASHTYIAAGTYTVTLTVKDNEGASGTTSKTVTVAPPANVPPTAAFSTSSNALVLSADAATSSDSDGTVASYAWDFGDTKTATGKTVTHTYQSAGTYTVTLTVTDNQGATGVSTKTVTVDKAPNVAPTASFTSSASGLGLSVDGSTSSDPDGTVVSYGWSFGDGTATSTTTTPNTSHTYTASGTYAVKLTVTDDSGATAVQTQNVTITAPAVNQPPVAAFTSTVTDLKVALDGSGSTDADGSIASYAWNFGDGATDTGKTTSHTYSTAGTYTVSLNVTDDKGATTTKTATVTVTAPAAVPFALDAFGRTVNNGFGTADVGGAWSRIGSASALSVSGGAGKVSLSGPGAQAGAELASVKQTATDYRLQFSLDKAATGGGTYISAIGRKISTNNEYRAAVRLLSNGTATVGLSAFPNSATAIALTKDTLVPVTVSAGSSLSMRVQVTGTSPTLVRAKVWATGTAEPTAWTVSATDSSATLQTAGDVGVLAYESGSATNGAQVVSFQQLSGFKP
ncbi:MULTISPECIES: PKD domain-containing protein [unclassified Frondihabitans]|uniref:PKD domain-containing protein n=1 Tax=unclassified Frondihabitans TaxID=2626248 RepID=UPI000F4FBD1C|nr:MULTISPECIES: PKD domain-containing protein [unclassified Frondihabitans]RPE78765.1 PKD repeat protein [Frondihabitans sp. PhB153]RPF09046.1 PKD repeat protein [Frondihabitans sp. PhB161]